MIDYRNAGQFRHVLELQRATYTTTNGQQKKDWTSPIILGTVRGLVTYNESPEKPDTKPPVQVIFASYTIIMYYFPGLTALDRIIWDGHILNISSQPMADPCNRWLQCSAIEDRPWQHS